MPELDISATELRKQLRNIVMMWRRISAGPGAWLREEFVLREGVDCIAQPLPGQFRQGLPRMCFANARRMVKRRVGLTYCEGFVLVPMVPIPVHHGWAIDGDRRVIDPTLAKPELCAYVGVTASAVELARWRGPSLMADFDDCVSPDFILERCPALRELMPPMEG